jgi:hypothetical protein
MYRGKWHRREEGMEQADEVMPDFNPWQSTKAIVITGVLFVLFLFSPFPGTYWPSEPQGCFS